MNEPIFLDHQIFARPSSETIDKVAFFSKQYQGLLSSPHPIGEHLAQLGNKSLGSIYESLGASENDIFTPFSSGADAIFHVLFSIYKDFIRETGRNHFVTTAIEEAPILTNLSQLEKMGCSGKILPVHYKGRLTREILEAALKPRVALVSISWANALTGVINPIPDLAALCLEKGVRLHVDATNVIGKVFFRFQDLPIDYLTFSGERLHIPQGLGGLLQKKENFLSPFLVKEQQAYVPLLAGMALSLEKQMENFEHMAMEVARLKHLLEQALVSRLENVKVLFSDVERLPHVSCIAFPGIASDALLYALSKKGVYASIGGNHMQTLAQVLHACDVEKEYALSALSFGLSYTTTEKEIFDAADLIVETVHELRTLSRAL